MIITRLGVDLPDGWPGPYTPQWSFFRLRRETEVPQKRTRRGLTVRGPEPQQNNREQSRFRWSPSGWPQTVGPAMEVL